LPKAEGVRKCHTQTPLAQKEKVKGKGSRKTATRISLKGKWSGIICPSARGCQEQPPGVAMKEGPGVIGERMRRGISNQGGKGNPSDVKVDPEEKSRSVGKILLAQCCIRAYYEALKQGRGKRGK